MFNFKNGEQMLTLIQSGTDLYCPTEGKFVFLYNEDGAIACYDNIDLDEAVNLEKQSRLYDEYWGAFLGVGGKIWDSPKSADFKPEPGCSNLDFCEAYYKLPWMNTKDVIEYARAKKRMPDIKLEDDMAFIRYCSFLNTWLDFVVITTKDNIEGATAVVDEAMNEYWNSDNDCYGDLVEQYLDDASIPATVLYHDSDDESEEYENAWEEFCAKLGTPVAVLNP